MKWNERIREIREDNFYTQKYIASLLNIGQRTYCDYESGKTRIPIDSILTLAKFYNVSIDGFGYSSSKDLVNWTEQRRIPAMDSVASTQNLWAPELFYDDEKEQFLIVYASCVVDAGFDVGIEDEKNNHRLYYVTTKDFETFSEPKLFYDPGFSCIDAVIVKRAPKDYVMVVKDNTRPNRNIKVAFAESPEGPWSAASEPFTESFTEGPSVVKIGDDYYIYYDTYRKFIYSAHRTNVFKTFTEVTDSVTVPAGHKHGTILRAPRAVVHNLIELSKQK